MLRTAQHSDFMGDFSGTPKLNPDLETGPHLRNRVGSSLILSHHNTWPKSSSRSGSQGLLSLNCLLKALQQFAVALGFGPDPEHGLSDSV